MVKFVKHWTYELLIYVGMGFFLAGLALAYVIFLLNYNKKGE